MDISADTTAVGQEKLKPGGSAVGEWTIAVSVAHSLILAAGGGYVFYASIRPVTIATGYGAVLLDFFPWLAASLLLEAVWAVGPVFLLVLGLINLRRYARLRWWFAVAWLGAVAGATSVGLMILHDWDLLFSAFPKDFDGSPLGPSRFAPGAPYWPALIAAGGQLALCAMMIALMVVLSRKSMSRASGS